MFHYMRHVAQRSRIKITLKLNYNHVQNTELNSMTINFILFASIYNRKRSIIGRILYNNNKKKKIKIKRNLIVFFLSYKFVIQIIKGKGEIKISCVSHVFKFNVNQLFLSKFSLSLFLN